MQKLKIPIVLLTFLITLSLTVGCGIAEKAKTLKSDIVNITLDQAAIQLENSLNQQFPGVQLTAPQVLNNKGQVNWKEVQQTDLGNFVFYNMGNYQLKAVLGGDGVFKIQRINYATNETVSYAEFGVKRVNGKFKVISK